MTEQHFDSSELLLLNQVIGSLYDAAANVVPWSDAVRTVAEFWSADSHVAQVQDRELVKPDVLSTSWPSDAMAAYEAHYWKVDPFTAAAAVLPPGRANLGQELVDWRKLQTTEFFQEFWDVHSQNAFHLLGATVLNEHGDPGMLALYRSVDRFEFQRHDQQLFGVLLPHYRRALEIRRRFNTYASRADSGWRSLDSLPFGVIAVDGTGRLLMLNGAAEEILRSQQRLTTSKGRLHCASEKDERQLRARLESCLLHRAGESGSGGGELVFQMRHEDVESRLSVFVVPMMNQEYGRPSKATALIYLFQQPAPPTDDTILMTVFGLSPAEAKAVARLCAGHSPSEMSDAFGLSIHTIRNQLKSALSKVGARSQADLVARIAHSPAYLSRY